MTIYLFGTFGNLNEKPMGGGQTSARRIWHNFEKLGYTVEIVNRHRFSGPKNIVHKLNTMASMLFDIVHWYIILLFSSRKDTLAMAIGYGGVMAPLDSTIMRITKMLGYKSIFYLKGGGTEKMYKRGTERNSKLFKKTLLNSDIVLTEGEENVDLVNRVTDNRIKTCYMPNYIEDGFFPSNYPDKPSNELNILYFGRIDESKNVKLIVEIFNLVASKYPNAKITIVGRLGTLYANEVDNMISASPYFNRITRIGHSSHEELAKIMQNQHIFIFPSKEAREGHSNSLNEAMAWGIVPIVSSNNFLPSIVGDKSLVVDNYNAEDYVKTISYLVDNRLLEQKSKQMYQRVKENFTQQVVENKLQKILNQI